MSKKQTAQNGKGSKPRPVNRKSYDECPLWDYIKKKKAKEKDGNGGIKKS